nr:MAG TPA: hypothetical protein [Caudoviricetes sp.]
MTEKQIKYILHFVQQIKSELLKGKYNYDTDIYLQVLRCERYLLKHLEDIEESKVKK